MIIKLPLLREIQDKDLVSDNYDLSEFKEDLEKERNDKVGMMIRYVLGEIEK